MTIPCKRSAILKSSSGPLRATRAFSSLIFLGMKVEGGMPLTETSRKSHRDGVTRRIDHYMAFTRQSPTAWVCAYQSAGRSSKTAEGGLWGFRTSRAVLCFSLRSPRSHPDRDHVDVSF